MKIAPHLAYHEAGHAIVADALGVHCAYIEAFEDERGDGYRVAMLAPEPICPWGQFTAIALSMAGGAAEALIQGAPPTKGYEQDMHEAYLSAHEIIGMDAPKDDPRLDVLVHRGMQLAVDILNARWGAVADLAEVLIAKNAATEEDIAVVVAQYREPPRVKQLGDKEAS